MRKIGFVLAILLILSPFISLRAGALEPGALSSECAVLLDYETGQVLFEKNARQKAYPASTTKIMTAILAVENVFPEEVMIVSREAVDIDEPESSNIALAEGEELTVQNGLYAMMLPSANDAANVIAEFVGGSQEAFAAMMTAKAHMIGAADTNFTNAHGLHEKDHYTTAYDLALITRYAAGDDRFMRYFGAAEHTMPPTNKRSQERHFTNYQYMMAENSRFYNADVTGGKVGFTNPARHTMSTVAERGGRKLVCVVMGAGRDEKFTDTQKLLNYGFDEFVPHTIPKELFEPFELPLTAEGSESAVRFAQAANFKVYLHKDYADTDIILDYVYPAEYAPGDRYTAQIEYRALKTPAGMPDLLGSQKIIGTAEAPIALVFADTEQIPLEEAPPINIWPWAALFFISVSTVMLAFFAVRHYQLRKKRLERIRRMEMNQKFAERRIYQRQEMTVGEKLRSRQLFRM